VAGFLEEALIVEFGPTVVGWGFRKNYKEHNENENKKLTGK